MELKISIVTCSDTRDLAQDEAGAALEELIEAQGWTVVSHLVVRDDVSEIGDAIVEAADECHANVVLTCGGTGLSMRDVTPEATRAVCDREVPASLTSGASLMSVPRPAMLVAMVTMPFSPAWATISASFWWSLALSTWCGILRSWSMRLR